MVDLTDPTFWIPSVISVVAVILFYLDMRLRLKQDREATKATAELIGVLREEVQLLRKNSMNSQEIEREKLLQRKAEQNYRIIRDISKGLGEYLSE